MSASVLPEPKEILTPAVEFSTSVNPAHADSMLDATVKEELTGQFHLQSFRNSLLYLLLFRCECPQGFEGNPRQQCLGEKLMGL